MDWWQMAHTHTIPVDPSLSPKEAWLEICLFTRRVTYTGSESWVVVNCDEEECINIDRSIKDVAEMFRLIRRVVNSDPSRLEMIRHLMTLHPRLIIFYSYNFELDILRTLCDEIEVGEWNGHQKDGVPESDNWVYLVQYVAGAESWNCISTDAMVLYSLTYSYKNFIQAQGRIDRLNTKFETLYYYILASNSIVDRAIKKSLESKKNFNERKFMAELRKSEGFQMNFVIGINELDVLKCIERV